MIKRKKGPSNGELYTDEDWNNEATLAEASYAFSKVCLQIPMSVTGLSQPPDSCCASLVSKRSDALGAAWYWSGSGKCWGMSDRLHFAQPSNP